MRKPAALCFVAIVLLYASAPSKAQSKSAELSDVVDRLVRSVEELNQGWSHTSVPPIEGSQDVALEQWASGNRIVKITIIRYLSQEEAVRNIREFAAEMRANRDFTDAGEEGYSWGSLHSVIFRKRNIVVTINVKGASPDDEKQLRKQFARLVADAIK